MNYKSHLKEVKRGSLNSLLSGLSCAKRKTEISSAFFYMSVLSACIILSNCKRSDDGIETVLGCTDPQSLTFNEEATKDDGSCMYEVAVDCSRANFTISNEIKVFSGLENEVAPGSIIAIEAGTYDRIFFKDLNGTSVNPITIVNCGGKVEVGGENINNAIIIHNSSFVRVTGSGDPSLNYGIFIKGSKRGTQGIVASQFSTNIEIDHTEITKAGFAGIMIKTDPSCDEETSAERGGPNRVGNIDFVMRDIRVHHNYIHDVVGEGIYLGNSFYTGADVYCGFTQYPHEVRGVRVFGNIVERTGWDAIQVGSAVEDVKIYENLITNYALENKSSHRNGIQVGVGTTGEVFGNIIKSGSGPGVFIQGIGDNYVYNNLIVDAGLHSIIISSRPTPLSTDIVNQDFLGGIYIMNNTIIDTRNMTNSVIRESVNDAPENIFDNNLMVFSDIEGWSELKAASDWSLVSNLVFENVTSVGFDESSQGIYKLSPMSDAVDAGTENVIKYGVTDDLERNIRPLGVSFDVGAFESH